MGGPHAPRDTPVWKQCGSTIPGSHDIRRANAIETIRSTVSTLARHFEEQLTSLDETGLEHSD